MEITKVFDFAGEVVKYVIIRFLIILYRYRMSKKSCKIFIVCSLYEIRQDLLDMTSRRNCFSSGAILFQSFFNSVIGAYLYYFAIYYCMTKKFCRFSYIGYIMKISQDFWKYIMYNRCVTYEVKKQHS